MGLWNTFKKNVGKIIRPKSRKRKLLKKYGLTMYNESDFSGSSDIRRTYETLAHGRKKRKSRRRKRKEEKERELNQELFGLLQGLNYLAPFRDNKQGQFRRLDNYDNNHYGYEEEKEKERNNIVEKNNEKEEEKKMPVAFDQLQNAVLALVRAHAEDPEATFSKYQDNVNTARQLEMEAEADPATPPEFMRYYSTALNEIERALKEKEKIAMNSWQKLRKDAADLKRRYQACTDRQQEQLMQYLYQQLNQADGNAQTYAEIVEQIRSVVLQCSAPKAGFLDEKKRLANCLKDLQGFVAANNGNLDANAKQNLTKHIGILLNLIELHETTGHGTNNQVGKAILEAQNALELGRLQVVNSAMNLKGLEEATSQKKWYDFSMNQYIAAGTALGVGATWWFGGPYAAASAALSGLSAANQAILSARLMGDNAAFLKKQKETVDAAAAKAGPTPATKAGPTPATNAQSGNTTDPIGKLETGPPITTTYVNQTDVNNATAASTQDPNPPKSWWWFWQGKHNA